MEWCLDCHRNPEKLRPAARGGLQHGLRSRRRNQLELGARLVKEYDIQSPDDLLDVPPMSRRRHRS